MQPRAFLLQAFRLRRFAIAALMTVGLVSALLADSSQAQVRAGQNYPVTAGDIPSKGKDAVGFAVNPRNSRHVVGVWADWLAGECQFGVSLDAGRTWKTGDLQAPEGFSDAPCTVGPHLAEHMKQSVKFGGGNRVYTTFVSPRITAQGEEGKSLFVARSDDGGRTFGTATMALPAGASADRGPSFQLPRIGVDAGRRSDRVYVVAAEREQAQAGGPTREDITVAISNDSGSTWGPRVRANAADENALEPTEPVVAPDGSVYVGWRTKGRGAQPGQFTPAGFVTVAKSTDRGQTWNSTRAAAVTGYTYSGPSAPPFATQRAYFASSFPNLAVDPDSKNVYLVYGDGGTPTLPQANPRVRAADHFINPDEDVWFQRSSDAGGTWSAPRRINGNSPTEITQTRHPHVSVAEGGRVDIVWNDRRHWYRGCVHTHNPCQETRLGDTYYSYSSNRGASFASNRRITDRSTGLDVGYDYRFGTGWAYGPVSVPIGRDRILVGWMDTRLGNFDNDRQDIFAAQVAVRRPGAVPIESRPSRTAPDLSVALSRMAYPGGPEAVLGGTFVTRPWARVVIVDEDDPAAALAAGVLARANIATVLVSPSDGLPRRVLSEVRRMKPIGAFVLGDERALSAKVVSDVASAGVPADQITRLAGGSDAGTAALVARAMDRRSDGEKSEGKPAFDAAIIANPDSPDAGTASAWAANRRLPFLYVDKDSIPQETTDALQALGITRTYVVSNRGDVSNTVAQQLPAPTRLAGTDVAGTSRIVVRQARRFQVPTNVLYLTGPDPMTMALMGAPVGRMGGQLGVANRLRSGRDVRRGAGAFRLTRALDRVVVFRQPAPRPAVRGR